MVKTGHLVQQHHTANIPTGTSRLFGWGTGIRKSAGTTTRTYEVDLMATRYMTNRSII